VRRVRQTWASRLFGARGDRFEVRAEVPQPSDVQVHPADVARVAEVRALSTSQNMLMHVGQPVAAGEAVPLYVGSHQVMIARAELDAFLDSALAPAALDAIVRSEPELSRLLVLEPASAGETALGSEAVRFAIALGRTYGHRLSITVGRDATLGVRNAAEIKDVTGPQDVTALIAPESFGVRQFDIISGISRPLTAAGITVTDTPQAFTSGHVIVVTGHKDAQLREFLTTLGERQVLNGKYVFLCSCGAAGDTAFNSRLIRDHGVTAVHSFPETITAQAAADVTISFANVMQEPTRGPRSFDQLLRDAVNAARGENTPPRLWEALQKFLRGFIQVSDRDIGGYAPAHV
jgi:hypothetical protein